MAHVLCNMIVLRFALVTLLSFSCLLAGVGSQNLSSRDMAALQAIWEAWKNNTLDPANNLANWGNFSSDPCGDALGNGGWIGVTCANFSTGTGGKNESSVVNLELSKIPGLSGPIPKEIGQLSNLEFLILAYNPSLFGPIPKEIGQLRNLQFLELFVCNFTGHVPDISNLTNLQALNLGRNHFTGHVADVSKLTNLMGLYLAESNFTGEVSDLSNLTGLEYLNLSRSGFTGQVPDISNLTNLQNLDLSRSNFIGHIPDISKLTKLIRLDLSWSNFIGQVPDISNLIDLQSLYLSNNRLTCPLPNFTDFSYSLTTLDLSNNKFSCATPNFTSLLHITHLSLSSNRFETWNSSDEFLSFTSKLPRNVSVLDLSKLGINRPVPDQWSSVALSQLSELYLDENNLTGILNISAFVRTDISRSLRVLSLQNNTITNVLTTHDDYILAGVTQILLQGNPYCKNVWSTEVDASRCSSYCVPETCNFHPQSNSSSRVQMVMATSISITGSAVVLIMVILGFVFILRRNQKYIRALQRKINEADINAKRFEYDELRAATRNFALELKLGSGAYGAVYKGVLSNDVVVAVKQLFLETDEGRDDFVNEVLLIANLQHRNLVTLKGYCFHGKQTLLVYEYVDNCDLDKVLLSRQDSADSTAAAVSADKRVLSWEARLSICQGVAQGLYYLHASSQSRIIHRDIKASNVLLDKNLQPKIADFGLARPIADAQSVVMTLKCVGTPGYLAPEYMFHGQLSDKADVFSFGVLLLEIVSGKRNRDSSMPDDEVYLPSRAWKLHRENRLLDMKDPTVVVSEDEAEEVRRVLETAVLCVQNAPEKRPSMFLVAAMLAGNANVDVAPVEECDNWPDRRMLDEYDSEFGPLFTSSSSSVPTAQSGMGRLANSNAVMEISTLQTSKPGMCDEENPRHDFTL